MTTTVTHFVEMAGDFKESMGRGLQVEKRKGFLRARNPNGPPRERTRFPSLEAAKPLQSRGPDSRGQESRSLPKPVRRTLTPSNPRPSPEAPPGSERSKAVVTAGQTPREYAGVRTCAPRPPRLSRAPGGPTAWSRSSPRPLRPSLQPGPDQELPRSGCRAGRCCSPGPVRRRTRFAPLLLPFPAEAAERWRRPWRPWPCRSHLGGWRLRAAATS